MTFLTARFRTVIDNAKTMTHLKKTIAGTLLLSLGLLCASAQAAVSLLSVSDSVSATVGSISTSLQNSSKAVGKIAEGDYKVVAVAQAEQAGKTQLTLVPVAAANNTEPFNLFVAQADVKHSGVETGQIVHAQKQAYGLVFARADNQQPFALLLDQAWKSEVQPKVVS
ncbi:MULTISPECIES: hypothetical protein [Aquitalea]|uniref:Uncharacterized protein n=1 Tax=Aquitalea magnusonii TaxID=332411 RepID=A0A318JGR3_9NEIS|nr:MULTISPECIES: hypothetical protein [Aquitalea]PXX46303.1 hypothetical protein DFR38_109145 [Aquitalea magnusonii]